MNPLEPPDGTYLEAAQGWLDLGNHREASEELDKISPENQAHPDVLQARCLVYAKAGNWDAFLEIVKVLTEGAPDWRDGWLQLARNLRRQNRTAEARDLLIAVCQKSDRTSPFPFYLACYCAQLGLRSEARTWMAIAMDHAETREERKQVWRRAQEEPDLEQLWKDIGEIV